MHLLNLYRGVDPVLVVLATADAARHVIVALIAVAAAVLVFAIGKAFLPGAPAFATLVIWICSIVGAEIAHWVSESSSSSSGGSSSTAV
jgi:hypothetical protein